MLFGEKYPDPVRMVSMGDFSKELCGGTHLENTADVQAFEITAEESVSSGTRRIEALTGQRALELQSEVRRQIEGLVTRLRRPPIELPQAVRELSQRVKQLKKQIAAGRRTDAAQTRSDQKPVADVSAVPYQVQRHALRQIARGLNIVVKDVLDRVDAMIEEAKALEQQLESIASTESVSAATLLDNAETLNGIRVIVQEVPHSNPNLMRQLIDQLRKQDEPVAVFLATTMGDDKVILVAGLSRSLVERGVSAGEWVKVVAPIVGGGGGGKPDLAQAGGKQPDKLNEALDAARAFARSQWVPQR